MQPTIILQIFIIFQEEIFYQQLLLNKLFVVPEGDEIFGGYYSLGMFEDETAHNLLLLGHGEVFSDEESG